MKVAVCIQPWPLAPKRQTITVGTEFELSGGSHVGLNCPPGDWPDFFRIEERPDGPWKPRDGELFWTIDGSLGYAYLQRMDYAQPGLVSKVENLNCFRTREDAEAKIPAVRNALKGRSLKDVLEGIRNGLEVTMRRRCGDPTDIEERTDDLIADILTAWESK